jgi:ferredoxin-like protein FixX
MRADGMFIAVEVDDAAAADAGLARALAEACPVDIFAQTDSGTLELVERNLDECVLCRLCLDAADRRGAPSAVKVIKLYDDAAVLA